MKEKCAYSHTNLEFKIWNALIIQHFYQFHSRILSSSSISELVLQSCCFVIYLFNWTTSSILYAKNSVSSLKKLFSRPFLLPKQVEFYKHMLRPFSAMLNQNCRDVNLIIIFFINSTSDCDEQPDLRNITLGWSALLLPYHFWVSWCNEWYHPGDYVVNMISVRQKIS